MNAGVPAVRVWDVVVRCCHWGLALCVALAWLTRSGGGVWHEWLGYATLLIVAIRLAWGWIGPPSARFARFVRSPAATLRYARQVLSSSEPRHLGHNPLGGWMIAALLLMTAAAGLSGWLFTTDAFWGEAWLERVHYLLAVGLLALIALHVAGVIVTSLRHHENLAGAMINGRKRAPAGNDIPP